MTRKLRSLDITTPIPSKTKHHPILSSDQSASLFILLYTPIIGRNNKTTCHQLFYGVTSSRLWSQRNGPTKSRKPNKKRPTLNFNNLHPKKNRHTRNTNRFNLSVFLAMEFPPEAVSKSCHATKHKLPGQWNCYVPGIARMMDFRNSHWNQGGVSTNCQVDQFRSWKNHAGKAGKAPNQGRIGKTISCWDHQHVWFEHWPNAHFC